MLESHDLALVLVGAIIGMTVIITRAIGIIKTLIERR